MGTCKYMHIFLGMYRADLDLKPIRIEMDLTDSNFLILSLSSR